MIQRKSKHVCMANQIIKLMKQLTIRLFAFLLLGAAITSCNDDDDNIIDDPEIISDMFISSNTSGMITQVTIDDEMTMMMSMASVQAQDADGVYYDEGNNVLYQVNRTSNVVNAYTNAGDIMDGSSLSPSATSPADEFSNGREMAYSNGQIIVADDDTDDMNPLTSDQLVIFSATGSSIQHQKTLSTPTNLWGIQLNGNDLWAIEDNSSNVVVFRNIFDNDDGDSVTPDKTVEIEGIVRTHGLDYDTTNDVMVLTDVGSGADDSDGGFSVITGFEAKFNTQDMISTSDQVTVSGNNTFLGNPVDVAYDHAEMKVYIAERANGSGRFLAFDVPGDDSNLTPTMNQQIGGASAIYLK